MPRLSRQFLPTFNLSFNPNEIGGALAWAAPLLLGLALVRPQHLPTTDEVQRWRVLRAVCLIGGLLGLLALGLGQSRFALAGVGVSLVLLSWLGLSGKARWLTLGALSLLALAQLALLLNWFDPSNSRDANSTSLGLTSRDEHSLVTRLQIWDRGLRMMTDQPLTGIGMAMFRSAVAQPRYVIPYFQQTNQIVPHAHNEFIQIGAEMGLGGLSLFIGLYAACGWCLWRTWRHGSPWLRGQALAVGAALLAHALYSLGDAISLWDRYSFMFGLLWAWCAALEVTARQAQVMTSDNA
ncbi:MAG: O-antigen ligase family protein [Anaerolineae bacterium]|nr:O-antigen ligase family protein [Anaerolineae bacterium]